MTRQILFAQLGIIDGAWQEVPDTLAIFDPGTGRGTLFLVAEVAGETEGRDELARELLETARRAYAASHGAITLALAEAVRAANDFFFNHNASQTPEARRIAGLVTAVVREDDLFIAQAGPGVTCLLRGAQLQSFPSASIWFDPNNDLAVFPTPGAAPLGMRRTFAPDVFHVTLQPGDSILVSTRSLKTLLTDEELTDTLADRHPDEIVTALEDIAGASDLSVIAIRVHDPDVAAIPMPLPPPAPMVEPAEAEPPLAPPLPVVEEPAPPPAPAPRAEPKETKPRADLLKSVLTTAAASGRTIASAFSRVNWSALGEKTGRALDALGRGAARFLVFVFRLLSPGAPKTDAARSAPASPDAQSGWRLMALTFPFLLIVIGVAALVIDLREVQTRRETQTNQLIQNSNTALTQAKASAGTDKKAALALAQKALDYAAQACALNPATPPAPPTRVPADQQCRLTPIQAARNAYFEAQDFIDTLNGIAIVFIQPAFANYTDAKSNATRIVVHGPDVFVLDRGAAKVYRYLVDDVGSKAAPAGSETGVILKPGDKFSDHSVTELIDLFWNENGRLVALERSGLFLSYDLQANRWSGRLALDALKWKSVALASSYVGNLYLLDPLGNQILKYVAGPEGWTASTTFFLPGVAVDLTSAADIAIDGDVWILRANGMILRYNQGKPVDFALRDPQAQLFKPAALYTSASTGSLYIADAGNKRLVQIDKANGKLLRQFRPSGLFADAFSNLKALAVDEAKERFFFVSGNQAYLATIPK